MCLIILLSSFKVCGSLKVTLKNKALREQSLRQGIFQLSSTFNKRPSWKSKSQAIWNIRNEWVIGNLDDVGKDESSGKLDLGITSQEDDHEEVDDPQDIVSWIYYNGDKDEWLSPEKKNDIIVECIDGTLTIKMFGIGQKVLSRLA